MGEVAHVFVCPGYRLPVRELECADVNGEGIGGGHLGGRSSPRRTPLRPKSKTSRTTSTEPFQIWNFR
jgi:hypothetical protein